MRWKCKALLLLTLGVLCLAGCSSPMSGFVSDDYLSVVPHDEDYAQSDPVDALEASTYDEIVEAILSLIEERASSGVIRIAGYDGEVPQAVAQAVYEVMRFTPYGAYYVDYINHECTRIVSYYEATLYLTYREGTAETLTPVRSEWAQESKLYQALEAHESRLTFYVSAYTNIDYQTLANTYYAAHEETVLVCPRITVETYPETGDARIVDLKLDYGVSTALLKTRAQAVEDVLSSAIAFVQYRQTDYERMELLWSFLMDRFQYRAGQSEMPIYALLCEGIADSDAFSKTLQALCNRLDIVCYTVSGFREGEAYTWNIVCLDGVYYHVDLMHGSLMHESSLTLRFDSEMTQYQWAVEDYPACVAAQTETEEAGQTEQEPPTEPAEQTSAETNEN